MTSELKSVLLKLPPKLLQKLDEAAVEEFMNRSEFMRAAIVEKLQRVDERRAQLMALTRGDQVVTEAEIFKSLKVKRGRLYARELERQLRKG